MFFEEEHAVATAAQLRRDGFEAACAREPFAGEDDDEDHPWVVTTDAPEAMVELLVERFEGWSEPDAPPPPVRPFTLPDAPRRVRRER